MCCLNCHQLNDSGRLLPWTLKASKMHLLHDIVGHFHLRQRSGMRPTILGIHMHMYDIVYTCCLCICNSIHFSNSN